MLISREGYFSSLEGFVKRKEKKMEGLELLQLLEDRRGNVVL